MKVKNYKEKIIDFDKIEDICNEIRKNGSSIVTTNGCFDILHLGHVDYLQSASEHCDVFILGINSQNSTHRIKGNNRPVNSEKGRVSVAASLGFVDYCVIFDEDTPVDLLSRIKPDIHIKGGDYLPDDLVEKKIVEDNGGIIKIIPFVEGYSTTSIIKKIISS